MPQLEDPQFYIQAVTESQLQLHLWVEFDLRLSSYHLLAELPTATLGILKQ